MTLNSNVTKLETRQPTGKPAWPIMLIAGVEKSGKSFSAAQASASEHIGRTLWVSFGEDDPDEYGAIPGARFEIVQHDGTYRGLLNALDACVAQPKVNGKPNLIVLDSASRVWTLLGDEQQIIANERARRKAQRSNRPVSDEDASIGRDQWNTATDRWNHVLDSFRAHQGPSILTALLEQVSGTDDKGQPTSERYWKVQGQKRLTADVGVVVEMLSRGDTYLSGVRSLKWQSETGRESYPDFTVEKVWNDLGILDKDATSERRHSSADPEDKPQLEADLARRELGEWCDRNKQDRAAVAAKFADVNGGLTVKDANAAEIRGFIAAQAEAVKAA